ncbi:MAG: MBL fold metallo-hydrolase [Clostridia bacterium]|nr:MBL fold metallo-hydrolase [Clostridia bacterium]
MLEKITINAHSSIRIAADRILCFDPFRLESAPHDADVIFITHAHFDHFSPEDIEKAAKSGTKFVIPAGMAEEIRKAGIMDEDVLPLVPGQTAEICGIPVEAVPSYNIGKPMHPKANGWLGYIVTVNGERIYVAGDTDATPEGAAVNCSIAMIPIGGTYTMNAEEAAALVNAMQPKVVIPTHYGSLVGDRKDAETFAASVDDSIEICLKL